VGDRHLVITRFKILALPGRRETRAPGQSKDNGDCRNPAITKRANTSSGRRYDRPMADVTLFHNPN
jgi:hypothetical protein